MQQLGQQERENQQADRRLSELETAGAYERMMGDKRLGFDKEKLAADIASDQEMMNLRKQEFAEDVRSTLVSEALNERKQNEVERAALAGEDISRAEAERRASTKNKAASAAQKTAEFRASMFDDALGRLEDTLGYNEETGEFEDYDPTGWQGLWDKATNKYDVTRWLSSDEGIQYQSDANTVKEQVLRTATGAAAPNTENEEYLQTLIPAPGDGEAAKFKIEKLRTISRRLRNAADAGANQEELNDLSNDIIDKMRKDDMSDEELVNSYLQ
jgi:hypothetical protein